MGWSCKVLCKTNDRLLLSITEREVDDALIDAHEKQVQINEMQAQIVEKQAQRRKFKKLYLALRVVVII